MEAFERTGTVAQLPVSAHQRNLRHRHSGPDAKSRFWKFEPFFFTQLLKNK